jgi:hypothetical protein
MTTDALIFAARIRTDAASKITEKMWDEKILDAGDAAQLVTTSRELLCAALALERRATGKEEPTSGN